MKKTVITLIVVLLLVPITIYTLKQVFKGETAMESDISLPEGYSWQQKAVDTEDLRAMNAFFDNRYAESEENVDGEIPFETGNFYETSLSEVNDCYKTTIDIQKEIQESLENEGWQHGIRWENYQLFGAAADGPMGSIRGFLKEKEGNLKTIVYSYKMEGEWSSSEEGPPHLEGPCEIKLTVFISSHVEISEAI